MSVLLQLVQSVKPGYGQVPAAKFHATQLL